jgi:thiamine biosynthesis lipoprotein
MTRTVPLMGTFVTIQVVGDATDPHASFEIAERVERAFGWFRQVEACCTRFDPGSEAMQLTARIGVPVPVSEILFEAVRFSVAVAETTGGAFDSTVGHQMETRGFNREYRTGQIVRTALEPGAGGSYRDIRLDFDRKAITLLRPLILDLGAVAKGLAIDLAARELQPLVNFAIDAGGDLYLGGRGPGNAPWSVGIRHPREDGQLIDSLIVSDAAVCTSGDYERRSADDRQGHHILDPRTGVPADAVASATVVAPTAMVADALATAAFVLGPTEGLRLLERQGVEGLIVSPALERHATRGLSSAYSGSAILPNAERPSHTRADAADRRRRGWRRRQAGCAGTP